MMGVPDISISLKSITVYLCETRLKFPFKTANVINYIMNPVITSVESEEGIIGYGEAVPAWEVTGETGEGMFSIISRYIIPLLLPGEKGTYRVPKNKGIVKRIFRLRCDKKRTIGGKKDLIKICADLSPPGPHGGSVPEPITFNYGARHSVISALYDLYARSAGIPLFKMFGNGPDVPLPVKTRGVVGSFAHPDEAFIFAEKMIGMGARSLKIKIGPYPDSEKELIHRLREKYPSFEEIGIDNTDTLSSPTKNTVEPNNSHRIGEDIIPLEIHLDANQFFGDIKSVEEYLDDVEKYDIAYLEQPFYRRDLEKHAELKEITDIPIALDESIIEYKDAVNAIKLKSADIINIKTAKHGGFPGSDSILELCKTKGIRCILGSMIENTLGTALNYHYFLGHPYLECADLIGMWAYAESDADGPRLSEKELLYIPGPHKIGCGADPSGYLPLTDE